MSHNRAWSFRHLSQLCFENADEDDTLLVAAEGPSVHTMDALGISVLHAICETLPAQLITSQWVAIISNFSQNLGFGRLHFPDGRIY